MRTDRIHKNFSTLLFTSVITLPFALITQDWCWRYEWKSPGIPQKNNKTIFSLQCSTFCIFVVVMTIHLKNCDSSHFFIGLLYEFLVTFDSFTSSLQEDIFMTGLPVVQEDILHLFSPETMTLATVGFSYHQVLKKNLQFK